MNIKNKTIILTGGSGFLGSHVREKLIQMGIASDNILIPRSKDIDLTKQTNCQSLLNSTKPDIVIHLAGKVGGIGLNRERPAELFYDNLIMGVELINAAYRSGVKKFVVMGTICAYPKFTPVPFKEEDLWNSYPEETNAPYGIAKKALLVQAQAYRKQFGFNAIYLLPVNLYGPRDNFEPEKSHVIPALIKKIADAIKNKRDYIDVWGTGNASREFLYVEDAAEAIVLATQNYNGAEPINIGAGFEITIKELANKLCTIMKYRGKIHWDKSKPDGQPRRCLDVTKAEKEFGFKAKTSFEEGLAKTVNWYLNQT
jgi:GDP-L-fucose synthase